MEGNLLNSPIVNLLNLKSRIGRGWWRSDWGWLVLLASCAVLPYANSLVNGFVYDDGSQILENQYIRSFRYLRQIFTTPVFSYIGIPSRYYRPMMTFGYLLCYKVFGFSPTGFHAVNVALHAAIVCLLFFVSRRIFGDRMLAFAAAAAFALHPIHTEAVDWIAAVTDLELTFFYLLTFWFFLMHNGSDRRRFVLTCVAMLVSFGLALLSKEQAVTLPLVATVYEHFYREDRAETGWARKFSRYGPLWIMAAAYIPLRMFSLGGFVVVSNYGNLTPYQVLLSACALPAQYLWKLVWPVSLSGYYVFHKSASPLEPPVIAGVLCAVLLLAGFVWLWKRIRLVSFGLVWMLATLAPVLNPKWLGLNVFTERYLYLPSVGFCWIVGWGLRTLWAASTGRPALRRALVTGLSVLALLCAFRIVTRNRDWHDDVTFYTRTLDTSPAANLIRVNLGTIYRNRGLMNDADREFREALLQEPNCAECLNNIAWNLMAQSRYTEARELLTKAIRLSPRAVWARLNLGIVYLQLGMTEGAGQEFRAAAAVAPKDIRVWSTLGSFYQQQGELAQAEAAYQRVLSVNPYHGETRVALGRLFEAEHRPAEAIREYQTALENEPGLFDATVALRKLKADQK